MEVSKHMHLLYMLLSSTQRLLLHCLQKLALHSIKWGNILQMISNEEIRVRRQRWQRQCLAYKEKYNIGKERQKDCWNKSIRKNSEYRRLKMGNWGEKVWYSRDVIKLKVENSETALRTAHAEQSSLQHQKHV